MIERFLRWRCATFHTTGWPINGSVKCFSCRREWPVVRECTLRSPDKEFLSAHNRGRKGLPPARMRHFQIVRISPLARHSIHKDRISTGLEQRKRLQYWNCFHSNDEAVCAQRTPGDNTYTPSRPFSDCEPVGLPVEHTGILWTVTVPPREPLQGDCSSVREGRRRGALRIAARFAFSSERALAYPRKSSAVSSWAPAKFLSKSALSLPAQSDGPSWITTP